MRKTINAGIYQIDSIRVVEHMRIHLESMAMTVVERAIHVFHDCVACEILRAIGDAPLEAGVTVGVDECRHDGLTAKINANSSARQMHTAFRADLCDHAVFYEHRAICNGWAAIAG